MSVNMRTKKVSIIFTLTLVLSIFLSCGAMSFIEFDRRNIFIFKGLSTIIPAILSFIFSIITLKIGQDFISTSSFSEDDRDELRRRSNKLIVQNSFLYILLTSFVCYIHDTNAYFGEPVIDKLGIFKIISYIIFAIVTILPANFILSYTYKSTRIRIPDVIGNVIKVISIILLVFILLIAIYKILPLSVFRYLFTIDKNGVWIKDKIYSDARTSTENIEIPNRVLGMKVLGLSNVDVVADKITLPDSCTGEGLDKYFAETANIKKVEGANVTTTDGIIYSVDKKYMNFIMKSSEESYTGSKLVIYKETQFITGDITNLKNVSKIEVEEGNDVFKSYGGALYITSKNANNYNKSVSDNELLIILPNKMVPSITLDDIKSESIKIETKLSKFKLNIGKNVDDIKVKGKISEYVVDEENPNYSSYMGNLYSKDKKNLLFMANRNVTETLAKEIEHISTDAIKSLNSTTRSRYNIKLEPSSENLCIIDGLLMNKAQSIIYAIARRKDVLNKQISVVPDVKMITKELIEYANTIVEDDIIPYGYKLSPDNQYMSKVSSEGIVYKTGFSSFETKSIYDEETDSLGKVGRLPIVEIVDEDANSSKKEDNNSSKKKDEDKKIDVSGDKVANNTSGEKIDNNISGEKVGNVLSGDKKENNASGDKKANNESGEKK